MNSAIAIGKTELSIIALKDTILKRMPLDSGELPDTQKMDFKKGDRLPIMFYKRSDNNHYRIMCTELSQFGHWYAFADHVQIDDPNAPPMPDLITLTQLANIANNTPVPKLEPLLQPLNETMMRYEINTKLRMAHFIAQIAHESDSFNALEEYASGADYEWREDLGNTQDGDGRRYKGRSLIQITGRANYASISKDVGIDFVSNPELLADPQYAVMGAAWFWDSRNLNAYADADDVNKITRIINGGFNHLAQRIEYLDRAKRVLQI